MKRIVLWLMATLTVVTLLFGYHTSTSSEMAGGRTSVLASPSGGGSTTSGTTGGTTSGGGAATGGPATVTGDSTDTRWGPVRVRITVADGKITDVQVVDYPNGNRRDQQINSQALPILVQETLDAQSAHIDMVSGATVTSEGYLGSLQSALDQAGL
jgi:major membrane immunogen (membrane-anchored lipoprotein)